MFSDILACASGKRELHFFGSVVRVADCDGALVIDGKNRKGLTHRNCAEWLTPRANCRPAGDMGMDGIW